MYASFSLKNGFHIRKPRIGFRITWWSALFVGMYFMIYYMMIGIFWMVYWVFKLIFLFYKWLFVGIVKLVKFLIKKVKGKTQE